MTSASPPASRTKSRIQFPARNTSGACSGSAEMERIRKNSASSSNHSSAGSGANVLASVSGSAQSAREHASQKQRGRRHGEGIHVLPSTSKQRARPNRGSSSASQSRRSRSSARSEFRVEPGKLGPSRKQAIHVTALVLCQRSKRRTDIVANRDTSFRKDVLQRRVTREALDRRPKLSKCLSRCLVSCSHRLDDRLRERGRKSGHGARRAGCERAIDQSLGAHKYVESIDQIGREAFPRRVRYLQTGEVRCALSKPKNHAGGHRVSARSLEFVHVEGSGRTRTCCFQEVAEQGTLIKREVRRCDNSDASGALLSRKGRQRHSLGSGLGAAVHENVEVARGEPDVKLCDSLALGQRKGDSLAGGSEREDPAQAAIHQELKQRLERRFVQFSPPLTQRGCGRSKRSRDHAPLYITEPAEPSRSAGRKRRCSDLLRAAGERVAGVLHEQLLDVVLGNAAGPQFVGESGWDIGVTGAAGGAEVAAETNVVREKDLFKVALSRQCEDELDPSVSVVFVVATDRVELDVCAASCDRGVVFGAGNGVAVADDHAARIDAFGFEDRELFDPVRPSGGVGGDREARFLLCPCCRAQDAFFEGRDRLF